MASREEVAAKAAAKGKVSYGVSALIGGLALVGGAVTGYFCRPAIEKALDKAKNKKADGESSGSQSSSGGSGSGSAASTAA